MGLFNKIGRNFEQFKKRATDAAKETAEYQCQACGTRFHVDHEECPECGAEEVEQIPAAE